MIPVLGADISQDKWCVCARSGCVWYVYLVCACVHGSCVQCQVCVGGCVHMGVWACVRVWVWEVVCGFGCVCVCAWVCEKLGCMGVYLCL